MQELDEDFYALLYDLMRAGPIDIRNKSNSTGVMLIG